MKNKGLTLTIVMKANSANFGEKLGNISTLKKMTMLGKTYTVISHEALRHSLVDTLEWNTTACEVDGAAQFSTDSSIKESPEIDLFGYFKSKTTPNRTRRAVARISPAISLEEFHNEIQLNNNVGLSSRIGNYAKTNGQKIFYSEQHYSYYVYTVTIDLDRVGYDEVDGEKIEILQEEKAARVNKLLEGIFFLRRDFKAQPQNLRPLFVIGGIYSRRNPFFADSVYLKKDGLDIEELKDIKDFLTEKTYVGVEKKAFSNSDEIIDELGAVKPRKVLEELMKEVSCYYGK